MKKVLENNYNLTDVEIIKNIESTDGNVYNINAKQGKYILKIYNDELHSRVMGNLLDELNKKNFPKAQLEYVDIEWSPSYGGYLIRFKDENNKIHSFIINNKYFPIKLGQGVFAFREEYTEKYDKVEWDTDIGDYNEVSIEKDIKKNKQHRANRKETEDLPVKRGTIDSNVKILKEITKIQDFTDLKYSF